MVILRSKLFVTVSSPTVAYNSALTPLIATPVRHWTFRSSYGNEHSRTTEH